MFITGFEISSWTLLHFQLLVIPYLEILRGQEGVRGQLNIYMYHLLFSLCPCFYHPQIELHILEERCEGGRDGPTEEAGLLYFWSFLIDEQHFNCFQTPSCQARCDNLPQVNSRYPCFQT